MTFTDSSHIQWFGKGSDDLGSPCGLDQKGRAVSGESLGRIRPNVLPQVELNSNKSCGVAS